MQIKEVQEKLKISSYTLRYYEKMGLIQPYRDENGYRNYSEEDIHKIERIMFLRDINVPIEDIKDILNNKVTFQDVLESHIQKVNTEIESLQYIKNMCEDLKEKNIPLLDQVIEGNQIGNEKVKKKDLKKVFDYFKKDQTVVIGYKSIPRSLLGISVLSLFISGIFGILIGLAFPNMISYVNEQTRSSVQHFQIPFYKASGKLIIFSMCISFIILLKTYPCQHRTGGRPSCPAGRRTQCRGQCRCPDRRRRDHKHNRKQCRCISPFLQHSFFPAASRRPLCCPVYYTRNCVVNKNLRIILVFSRQSHRLSDFSGRRS